MLDKVQNFIRQNNLLNYDSPIVVGVSGGADSIALLTILVNLGYSCIAAHCNFHLRGAESLRDEIFTRDYVDSLNVPFTKIDFDTKQYADSNHLSIEMAARDLRYDWFESIRKEKKAQAIAVAHHQDDSVETFLLNLVRGTGIRGLCGIRPKQGYVVRPLLCITKDEILNWISKEKLNFVIDGTNLSDEYSRNFIRLRVLPLLQELNPSIKQSIAKTASNLSKTEEIYRYYIDNVRSEVIKSNTIYIPFLLSFPASQTILYELLRDYGFSPQMSLDIYNSLSHESGKCFYSPIFRLIKDRDQLILTKIVPETELNEEIVFPDKEGFYQKPFNFSTKYSTFDEFQLCKDKRCAFFDADKLAFPLYFRKWQKGDWFIPFGMNGKKKISDYFNDHHFSIIDKENSWLLCSGNNIIWIVGERSDNRFCIDEKTSRVLSIKIID